jgi:hypothetical protein
MLSPTLVDQVYPKSYVTSVPDDVKRFTEDCHEDNAVFIMKKDIQSQKGLYLTNDKKEVLKKLDQYVVIQNFLKNPFTISGHKINMRVYMLVVITGKGCQFYRYHDGFIYYTPEKVADGSLEHSKVITTGYIDRDIYKNNPLTHTEFEKHLGTHKYSILQSNIQSCIHCLKDTFQATFFTMNKSINGTKFLVYGVDIAPDKHLNCKILEVNKGPNLAYHDDRDRRLKQQLLCDTFSLAMDGKKLGNYISV